MKLATQLVVNKKRNLHDKIVIFCLKDEYKKTLVS